MFEHKVSALKGLVICMNSELLWMADINIITGQIKIYTVMKLDKVVKHWVVCQESGRIKL